MREIKKKNLAVVYLGMLFSFGIYGLVWTVKSKRDMNALGAEIPTSWLLLVPLANFYWVYKYCEGFSNHIKKDNAPFLWFAIYMFAGFLLPYFVQTGLNEHAGKSHQKIEKKPGRRTVGKAA